MYIAVNEDGEAFIGNSIAEVQYQIADAGYVFKTEALRWFKAEEGVLTQTFELKKKSADKTVNKTVKK